MHASRIGCTSHAGVYTLIVAEELIATCDVTMIRTRALKHGFAVLMPYLTDVYQTRVIQAYQTGVTIAIWDY